MGVPQDAGERATYWLMGQPHLGSWEATGTYWLAEEQHRAGGVATTSRPMGWGHLLAGGEAACWFRDQPHLG